MNRKVFKLAIILCWATLAFCLIVKQFFPDMFLIVIENERFVAACDFIDGHIVIKEAIYALCSVISVGLYILIISQKTRFIGRENLVILWLVGVSVAKGFVGNIVSVIFDLINFIVIPLLLRAKTLRIICGIGLTLLFQAAALYIRSIKLGSIIDNYLVEVILMIDQYIMLLFYYIYANYNNFRRVYK